MAIKTRQELLALFADNTTGAIGADDLRDLAETNFNSSQLEYEGYVFSSKYDSIMDLEYSTVSGVVSETTSSPASTQTLEAILHNRIQRFSIDLFTKGRSAYIGTSAKVTDLWELLDTFEGSTPLVDLNSENNSENFSMFNARITSHENLGYGDGHQTNSMDLTQKEAYNVFNPNSFSKYFRITPTNNGTSGYNIDWSGSWATGDIVVIKTNTGFGKGIAFKYKGYFDFGNFPGDASVKTLDNTSSTHEAAGGFRTRASLQTNDTYGYVADTQPVSAYNSTSVDAFLGFSMGSKAYQDKLVGVTYNYNVLKSGSGEPATTFLATFSDHICCTADTGTSISPVNADIDANISSRDTFRAVYNKPFKLKISKTE